MGGAIFNEFDGEKYPKGRGVITLLSASPNEKHRAGVLMRDGMRCGLERMGDCRGELEAHHLIPKQRIKQKYAGWVFDHAVGDSRNGVMLCEHHHSMNTPDIQPSDIPDLSGLIDFAMQYGLEGSLLDFGIELTQNDQ